MVKVHAMYGEGDFYIPNVQLLFSPLWDADERRKTQIFFFESAKSAFFSVQKTDFLKESHIGFLYINLG